MNNIKKFLRNDLKDFKPYHSPLKSYKIKLDANESPYQMTQKVKEKIIEYIKEDESLNIYPDTDSLQLRKVLADFYSVNTENVICGVGSDQIIDMITKVFLNPGEKVVALSPSFTVYSLAAELNHGEAVLIDYDNNFKISANKIIEKVNSDPKIKVLFLCTPNNPTGNILEEDLILKVLDNVNCVVVVDEAYAEFSETTIIPKINVYNNLIVLRTFSKAYGLAGLRIGYGIASEEMIDLLNIAKPPYNISTLSEKIAIEVLKDYEVYLNRVQKIIADRDILVSELEKIPFINAYHSDANFIFLDSEKEISENLEEEGIFVRRFKATEGYKERLRISVGNKSDNKILLEAIRKI